MNKDSADLIREIEKKIILMSIIDTLGVIMVALWGYAKYGANSEPFHPILKNETVVNNLLVFGVLVMVLCGIQIVKLSIKKSKITNENNI